MSGSFDATPPDLEQNEVQLLSVIAHVIGFDTVDPSQPPEPAENARDADVLAVQWVASNATDEDIVWNFPTPQRFRLKLMRLVAGTWQPAWEMPFESDDDDEPLQVTVPLGEVYSIPKGESDEEPGTTNTTEEATEEPLEEEEEDEITPTVPLAEIIDELGIPAEEELAVQFELLAQEFPQLTFIPLWR